MKLDVTKEKFVEVLTELFHKWEKEEKGKRPYVKEIAPGLWEICDGTNTIWTGDGGKKLYDEALKKESENLWE